MRKFTCLLCNQTWFLPFGYGGQGLEQTCPRCLSYYVKRVDVEFRGSIIGKGRRADDRKAAAFWLPARPGHRAYGWTWLHSDSLKDKQARQEGL